MKEHAHPVMSKLEAEACRILIQRYGEKVGKAKAANFIKNCNCDQIYRADWEKRSLEKAV